MKSRRFLNLETAKLVLRLFQWMVKIGISGCKSNTQHSTCPCGTSVLFHHNIFRSITRDTPDQPLSTNFLSAEHIQCVLSPFQQCFSSDNLLLVRLNYTVRKQGRYDSRLKVFAKELILIRSCQPPGAPASKIMQLTSL